MSEYNVATLNPRKLRARLVAFLSPLSPLQHLIVASTTCFLLFTIAVDISTCFQSVLVSIKHIVVVPVVSVPVLFGMVLPGCILLRGYLDIHRRKVDKYVRLLIWLSFSGALFILAEMIYPFSVLPFTTTLSALLVSQVWKDFTQDVPAGRRRAVIALVVILVLSVRYIDLDSRKPFARHLFLVRAGMTGEQVERIMSSHIKNWVQPESEHYLHLDRSFTGEAWYRHTTAGWGDAEWGKVVFKDGRVVDAEICLCD